MEQLDVWKCSQSGATFCQDNGVKPSCQTNSWVQIEILAYISIILTLSHWLSYQKVAVLERRVCLVVCCLLKKSSTSHQVAVFFSFFSVGSGDNRDLYQIWDDGEGWVLISAHWLAADRCFKCLSLSSCHVPFESGNFGHEHDWKHALLYQSSQQHIEEG